MANCIPSDSGAGSGPGEESASEEGWAGGARERVLTAPASTGPPNMPPSQLLFCAFLQQGSGGRWGVRPALGSREGQSPDRGQRNCCLAAHVFLPGFYAGQGQQSEGPGGDSRRKRVLELWAGAGPSKNYASGHTKIPSEVLGHSVIGLRAGRFRPGLLMGPQGLPVVRG